MLFVLLLEALLLVVDDVLLLDVLLLLLLDLVAVDVDVELGSFLIHDEEPEDRK